MLANTHTHDPSLYRARSTICLAVILHYFTIYIREIQHFDSRHSILHCAYRSYIDDIVYAVTMFVVRFLPFLAESCVYFFFSSFFSFDFGRETMRLLTRAARML